MKLRWIPTDIWSWLKCWRRSRRRRSNG